MKEKILIVDDEKNILHAFRRSLRDVYHITTALCGQEALKLLREEAPFAVIVSDYKMPGMNGLELLTEARRISPHMVRIMLTGYPDRELALNAVNKGQVFQFLTKPCSSDQLKEIIGIGIGHHYLLVEEKASLERELRKCTQKAEVDRKREEKSLKPCLQILEPSLKRTYLSLSLFIQKRDLYTALHQVRVTRLAKAIAKKMGLEPAMVDWISIAAGLHDLGNTQIPLSILLKPDTLTRKEEKRVRGHVLLGVEILEKKGFLDPILTIVLEHHERLDGSGYPYGRKGEDLHFGSKVLAVADVVEAMGSHRPYRQALPLNEILEELTREGGILYDEEVVEACAQLFEEGYELGGERREEV